MRVRLAWSAALLALIGGSAAFAEGITFTGETRAGFPTFNRPEEVGGGVSGGLHFYSAQTFTIPTNTTCVVEGAQNYDGYIHLYASPFNPAAPLTNLIKSDDDDPVITTRGSFIGSTALTAGDYVLVNSSFGAGGFGSFSTAVRCVGTQPITGPCNGWTFVGIPTNQTACLSNRFLVAIDQVTGSTSGIGTPVRLGSNDTQLFWFYFPANFEVMIKAIDACGFNNHWWVFIGALTDQGYRVRVFDTHSPATPIKTYTNAQGHAAAAVNDTSAFATCP